MTAPDFKGEVRLGVPHDIVGPYMPPVLKSFDQAWPGVRVSLVCSTTPKLLRALARRELDLTLTTECDGPLNGETLLQDSLVWVGARDGRAYKRDPLPVSSDMAARSARTESGKAGAGVRTRLDMRPK